MLEEQVDLETAAVFLGLSTRQVRRNVQDGKLPADGGGQGKALLFRRADLEAAKRAADGVFDADLLARAVYALRLFQETKEEKVFPRHETQMIWKWHKRNSPAHKFLERRFPPLSDVPPNILKSVRRICSVLDLKEINYLAGMVVVVAHPWEVYAPEERAAVERAQDAAMGLPETAGISLTETMAHAQIIDSALFGEPNNDLLKAYVEDRREPSGKITPGLLRQLQNDRGYVPQVFKDASRKGKIMARERGCGWASNNRVCALLDCDVRTGSGLVKSILHKLNRDRVIAWFMLLNMGDYVPPLIWKFYDDTPRKVANKRTLGAVGRVCANCKRPVSDDDAFCPHCDMPPEHSSVNDRPRPASEAQRAAQRIDGSANAVAYELDRKLTADEIFGSGRMPEDRD